jgi:hypothetical protein
MMLSEDIREKMLERHGRGTHRYTGFDALHCVTAGLLTGGSHSIQRFATTASAEERDGG